MRDRKSSHPTIEGTERIYPTIRKPLIAGLQSNHPLPTTLGQPNASSHATFKTHTQFEYIRSNPSNSYGYVTKKDYTVKL